MKKPISSSLKNANIQEKIKILHKKAQDCVFEVVLSAEFDENQRELAYEKSIKFLDESIKLDPTFIKSHEFKTYVCILAGKKDQALKSLEIMLELDPGNKKTEEFHQDLVFDLQSQSNENQTGKSK